MSQHQYQRTCVQCGGITQVLLRHVSVPTVASSAHSTWSSHLQSACSCCRQQSDLVTVDSGVPQGTVLGPILFLLHINDLPSVISSKVRLFADDCLVYTEIKNRQDQIAPQKDLNLLENWGSKWGMRFKFNAAKCNIMRMFRKQTPISTQYELSGQVLEEVKDAKYLGVTVSDDLEWTKHINAITTKANSKLSFLRRNLKGCPEKLRETAYFALVRFFLEYSATVWHPHQKYYSDKLEMVQRRAARFVKAGMECMKVLHRCLKN